MNARAKQHQLELQMKANRLGIALEEVKKREDEQFMNMVMLMGSASSNSNAITCDKKII
jgi:hypothetical protein